MNTRVLSLLSGGILLALLVTMAPVVSDRMSVSASAQGKEPVFTVLNPEGIPIERQVSGLNPRLDTLKGKKINVINLHGGNEIVIESIARDLKAAVPECEVVYYRTDGGYLGRDLTQEDWKKMLDCHAAIVGHAF